LLSGETFISIYTPYPNTGPSTLGRNFFRRSLADFTFRGNAATRLGLGVMGYVTRFFPN